MVFAKAAATDRRARRAPPEDLFRTERLCIPILLRRAPALSAQARERNGVRLRSIGGPEEISAAAIDDGEGRHGRTLNGSERYAIAKMALFQAFDERPDPAAMTADVCVRAADVEDILIRLGIE